MLQRHAGRQAGQCQLDADPSIAQLARRSRNDRADIAELRRRKAIETQPRRLSGVHPAEGVGRPVGGHDPQTAVRDDGGDRVAGLQDLSDSERGDFGERPADRRDDPSQLALVLEALNRGGAGGLLGAQGRDFPAQTFDADAVLGVLVLVARRQSRSPARRSASAAARFCRVSDCARASSAS